MPPVVGWEGGVGVYIYVDGQVDFDADQDVATEEEGDDRGEEFGQVDEVFAVGVDEVFVGFGAADAVQHFRHS